MSQNEIIQAVAQAAFDAALGAAKDLEGITDSLIIAGLAYAVDGAVRVTVECAPAEYKELFLQDVTHVVHALGEAVDELWADVNSADVKVADVGTV